MRHAGETLGTPAGEPGDDGERAGLGARLVALGGLELGEFDAVPAGPDPGRGAAVSPVRTREGEAASRRRTLMISAVVGAAVLGFFGTAAYLFVNIGGTSPAASPPLPQQVPTPSAAVEREGGPRAAAGEVRADDDLHRVCADWFYPAAPKYRGGAPHPVVISERAGPEAADRSVRTLNRAAFAGSATQRRAWAPEAGRAQLVACLDLTGPGKAIRDCRSGSETFALVEGRYRLTVYEVATHRKVIEKELTGTDRACPFVILSSAGNTLHSAVTDGQLHDLLRKPVEG